MTDGVLSLFVGPGLMDPSLLGGRRKLLLPSLLVVTVVPVLWPPMEALETKKRLFIWKSKLLMCGFT